MIYLLDTHALLWFHGDSPRLSAKARQIIRDTENQVLVSMASIWEIGIKTSLGKLDLGVPMDEFLRTTEQTGFEFLPVKPEHVVRLCCLPMHHRDPFDRMIAAQAIQEAIEVISCDPAIDAYGVRRIW